MDEQNCRCHKPQILYSDYVIHYIGTDLTNGRYGEVTIEKCNYCSVLWLRYFVEYEGFAQSGRWFRGVVNENDITNITPENSINYLEKMEWHLCGGSYFNSTGRKERGTILVDI